MINDEMGDNGRRFLKALYNQTNGDPGVQASMFEIGETIGLARDGASKTAEELIGSGLVAVVTLSGGIGITDDGIVQARELGCATSGLTDPDTPCLGDNPILDDGGCSGVEQIVAVLKTEAGENSWDFATLTELMADLKTIDAQMISSKPKTAIIRECFRSIKGILEKAGTSNDSLSRVNRILGV